MTCSTLQLKLLGELLNKYRMYFSSQGNRRSNRSSRLRDLTIYVVLVNDPT